MKLNELFENKSTSRGWMAAVRKAHGNDVKFTDKKSGGGADNRIIATIGDEIVGSFNRNSSSGTVLSSK